MADQLSSSQDNLGFLPRGFAAGPLLGNRAQIAGLLQQVAEDMLMCQARQRLAFARGALTS